MTSTEFEKKWSEITAVNQGGGFEYVPELLMPKRYWSVFGIEQLQRGVLGWLAALDAEGIYSQIDFNTDQVTATKTLYLKALSIAEAAIHIRRDEFFEEEQFYNAFEAFFPDDLFIGRNQRSEAYRCLVMRPAGKLVLYREAMGQIEPVTEAIK